MTTGTADTTLYFLGSAPLSELQDTEKSSKYKDGDLLYCIDDSTTYLRAESRWEALSSASVGAYSEESIYKLPERCSNCGGSLADASKYKIGLSQIRCPYCESILNLEKES